MAQRRHVLVTDGAVEQGVEIIKFWAPPRGCAEGLYVDAPWCLEVVRRARAAGVKTGKALGKATAPSPTAYHPKPGEPPLPQLRGLALPPETLKLVCHGNARRLVPSRTE